MRIVPQTSQSNGLFARHQFLEALHHVFAGNGIFDTVDQCKWHVGFLQGLHPTVAVFSPLTHVLNQQVHAQVSFFVGHQRPRRINVGIAQPFRAYAAKAGRQLFLFHEACEYKAQRTEQQFLDQNGAVCFWKKPAVEHHHSPQAKTQLSLRMSGQ